PQFAYSGAEQFQADQRERWLEVEVTFACAPEFTDELTLKYFILVNGKLLTGEVTHVNIPAGRENRSVMYVTPKTLQRLMLGRTVTNNAVQNTAVQLIQQGALKDEISAQRAAPQWYATLPQVGGLVLKERNSLYALVLGPLLPNKTAALARGSFYFKSSIPKRKCLLDSDAQDVAK